MPMNYATKELTASLQELTSQSEQPVHHPREPLPASIAASDLTLSKEVQSFLERTREYSARTRDVHVGTY